MNKAHWTFDGLYVLGNSIVGTVSQAPNRLWYAYGCRDEWQDVYLGSFGRKTQAERAVQSWVKENA